MPMRLPFPWGRPKPLPDPETKASATAALIAFQTHGQPAWTPRDYAALAREGYAKNAIVYRCVRMISEAAASVPWLLYDGAAELDDHPLLRLLARPNPRQSGRDLRETLFGHLLVSGNAYMEAVSSAADDLSGAAVPHELHALRPDRMKVVPGPDGWPSAYEYSVGGRTVRFDGAGEPPPILHLSLFHPLNDHYGFAPIEAAATALDIHNAAGTWNKALLDNAARPSGALVYQTRDGGNLSRDQFERLKEELEANFSGAGNAGRPLLLEGGLDWKAMALTPRDMDFLEAKNGAAREIALAFGVPPMLLGIPGDNTYANYKEANLAFWRSTVLPLCGRLAESLTGWLAPAFDRRAGDLRLWFDADQVDALNAEREALWARVGSADFLTTNEKRAAVGYGPVTGGEGGGGRKASVLAHGLRSGSCRPIPPGLQSTPAGESGLKLKVPPGEVDATSSRSLIEIAGGFSSSDRGMSVRDFIAANCKARIQRELPGQFLDSTIQEVMDLARRGDASARTCLKLLGRGKYRK